MQLCPRHCLIGRTEGGAQQSEAILHGLRGLLRDIERLGAALAVLRGEFERAPQAADRAGQIVAEPGGKRLDQPEGLSERQCPRLVVAFSLNHHILHEHAGGADPAANPS